MKALLSCVTGGPDTLVLSEVEDPTPGPREVRIAVKACAINYPDVLIIEDRYQFHPARPFSPGAEVSGVIDAVGADVTGLAPGTRVLAYTGWGGLAERVTVRADRCIPIPADLPFDLAASLQIAYGTALHALEDRAALRPGETLLVLGAAGGVGSAAIELGKILGARVVAATSTSQKGRVALERGADSTVVYPREITDPRSLAQQFKEACGGTADVVFDVIGGDYAQAALRTMAWEGRYLVVGFAAGVPQVALNLPLLKGCQISGVFWGSHIERSPDRHAAQMRRLIQLCLCGKIHPLISERFPLSGAGEAIASLGQRRALGKVVVELTG